MSSTYNRLLQVSLRQFSLYGYDGASLSSIAEEAGIKKASIYNHFNNKDSLFLEVVHKVYKDYLHMLKKALPQAEKNGLPDLLDSVASYLTNEENGKFYLHFVLFPPPHLEKDVRRKFMTFEEDCNLLLRPLFQQKIDNKEIPVQPLEPLLDAFYGLLDSWSVQTLYYDTEELKRKRRASWKFFWKGIGGRLND
ncbi:TetR/AcrR family transcriptional regulator [Alkalicoccus daliensis]|uniref:Transcriptional regulator, TetR family n=1 Tax=Alkalicoccus daliensis TaxID=745820 RepID=A0A1H0DX52_9BACI|nr:TetR/AcrR family transcriptional regulator [Alkalicoccus daliensis]SDN74613.1 transcriptional regulator, TetR family [Alkalicoccus daliensis]